MIQPTNGKYTIDETIIDSVLLHQKNRLLTWINELERCRSRERFIALKSKILGAIVILANLWSVFGYSYKSEELTKRLIFFLNYFLNKGFTKKCDDRNTLIVLMNNFYGYWTILSNLKKGIFDKLPRQSYVIYLIKMIKDLIK